MMIEIESKLSKDPLGQRQQLILWQCKRRPEIERNVKNKKLQKPKKNLERLLLKKQKRRDNTCNHLHQHPTLKKVHLALPTSFKTLCTNLSTQILPKLPIS
jgi:hypothetical protein